MSEARPSHRIVVTGASRGIGLEFVRQWLAAGHQVQALARDPAGAAELQSLAKDHPGALQCSACDVTSDASVQEARAEVEKRWDAVDLVVNNAGVSGNYRTPVESLDAKELHDVFEVNAVAPLRVTAAFLPLLRRGRAPKLVQLSTLMGSIGDNSSGGAYAYRMSKAALNMANRNLAHALGPQGIVCAALHPGWVQTDMGGKSAPLPVQESVAAMVRAIDGLKAEHNGAFLDRDLKPLPW
jgi:NAD(P)-dependent dehydrogenase (short-subunit alcohol dehydrogenase family)